MNAYKRVIVLGGGESGVGAAVLAQKKGYQVFLSDYGKIQEAYKHTLETNAIPYEEGKHTLTEIYTADLVVKSPGIPDTIPLIQQIQKKGIPIIDEIEFAYRHLHIGATIIAITGSNGKTTTTNLTYHLLKTAGLDVWMGGNVGYSFAQNISEHTHQYYILEMSSFQLDRIETFRPDVAILLNITPDHLDRYAYKMENYIQSKFRIAMNQNETDKLIFNQDNTNISNFLISNKLKSSFLPIKNILYNNGILNIQDTKFDMSACSLKGNHNYFNAMCAIQAAKSVGVSDEDIQEGLNTFQNDPHRMELVATINGVDFINDSKATNVDAVFYALQAMEKPIIWIVGGTDKGNDYQPLIDLVAEKVKALICMGIDNEKIHHAFSPHVKIIEETKSAEEAVKRAKIYAEAGDVVLLSPACASFDLFKNYKDRGNQFKIAVGQLK